jgi:cation diffusion facilitator family transporter
MAITKRQKSGQAIGVVGLLVNLALFGAKFAAGLVSHSIAIMADSFNNLMDCASALATILGFRLAGNKPDAAHPYGHGRMEYIAGLVISMLIIVTAFGVGEAAVDRIIAPEPVEASTLAIAVCLGAIVTKILLALYIRHRNRKVSSSTLDASAWDSVADTLSTSVALAALLISPLTDLPIDGALGVVVALMILIAGLKSFGDNMLLILGRGLTKSERQAVDKQLLASGLFAGIDEAHAHDYGPEARLLLVKTRLATSPHTSSFERGLKQAKRDLRDTLGFSEVVIYWSPRHQK